MSYQESGRGDSPTRPPGAAAKTKNRDRCQFSADEERETLTNCSWVMGLEAFALMIGSPLHAWLTVAICFAALAIFTTARRIIRYVQDWFGRLPVAMRDPNWLALVGQLSVTIASPKHAMLAATVRLLVVWMTASTARDSRRRPADNQVLYLCEISPRTSMRCRYAGVDSAYAASQAPAGPTPVIQRAVRLTLKSGHTVEGSVGEVIAVIRAIDE